MSKYYSIKNKYDDLAYFVYAPAPEIALRVVENLIGPMNPATRVIHELPECPPGYSMVLAGSPPQFLEESTDDET